MGSNSSSWANLLNLSPRPSVLWIPSKLTAHFLPTLFLESQSRLGLSPVAFSIIGPSLFHCPPTLINVLSKNLKNGDVLISMYISFSYILRALGNDHQMGPQTQSPHRELDLGPGLSLFPGPLQSMMTLPASRCQCQPQNNLQLPEWMA